VEPGSVSPVTGDLWPAWLVVLACATSTQVIKLLAYSLTRRELAFAALGQGHGLPSSPASVLSCLLVVVSLRQGWQSPETGVALVFAVIVIHDTVKLRIAASRQREVVFRIVDSLQFAGPFRQRVADYLDPRTHHPVHVVLGVIFGALFALALGLPSG
jgi:acid phosphatase family membrane protein YuiD